MMSSISERVTNKFREYFEKITVILPVAGDLNIFVNISCNTLFHFTVICSVSERCRLRCRYIGLALCHFEQVPW